MRRIIAALCALVLAFSGVPAVAWADAGRALASGRIAVAASVWSGSADVSWYAPDKTEFTLVTPEQVAGLAQVVNGKVSGVVADTFTGKTVHLGADLSLNAAGGKQVWTAIGDVNTGEDHSTSTTVYFDGVFDGGGHAVYGLYMPASDENYGGYHAFFGALGPHAVVSELGIESGEVYGRVAAGIAAVSRVDNARDIPQIIGCYNKATVRGSGSTSRGTAGIFAGENQNGTEGVGRGYRAAAYIADCYNLGTISGSGPTGGIAGTGSVKLYGCYNAGPVSSTTGGTRHGSLMSDLFARGSMTASRFEGEGDVANCYAYIGTDSCLMRVLDADHTLNNPSFMTGEFGDEHYSDTVAFLDADQMDEGAYWLGTAFANDDADNPANGHMPLLWWQVGKAKASMAMASVDAIGSQRYTGSAVEPALVVRIPDPDGGYGSIELNAGSDYRVTYENNTAIGQATAHVRGIGRYEGAAADASFNIVSIELSDCTIDAIPPQWYYGGVVKPTVVVRTRDDTVLTEGVDYDLVFSSNDRAGRASVTAVATGAGAAGLASADFYLVAASNSLDGAGTQDDPYRLRTKGDLQFLSHAVNTDVPAYIDAYYRVENDIDASAADDTDLGIDPIGLNHHPFAGTFDGAGRTITLGMDAEKVSDGLGFMPLIYDYLALFSCTGSAGMTTIENLTIDGVVESPGTAAAFIGSAVDAQLVMTNCVNKATVRSNGGAGTAAGGFIGVAAGTRLTMSDCVNAGRIIAGGSASGIVVYLNGGSGEHVFDHCGNEGSVVASESAGGVVQHYAPAARSSFKAENCYNTGAVVSYRSDGGAAGGILGMDQSGSGNANVDRTCSFIACCNTGIVSGGRHAGGIAGQIYTTPMNFSGCYSTGQVEDTGDLFGAGGICGAVAYKTAGWTFSDCYVAGDVVGSDSGAMLGWAYSGSQVRFVNCYYLDSLGSDCEVAGVGDYNIPKGVQEPVEFWGGVDGTVEGAGAMPLGQAAMRSASAGGLLSKLSAVFVADNASAPVNGGYPVCYWQFSLARVPLSQVTVAPMAQHRSYTGLPITQAVSARYGDKALAEGVDFVTDYADNVVPGTATVTMRGIGRYEGSRTFSFDIVKGRIDASMIADIPGQWCTDSGVEPELTVTNGAGKALVAGTDYTVSYSGNDRAGTATATVVGTGYYEGSASKPFTVVPAAGSLPGSGTVDDPYRIADALDFACLMAKVNAGDVDYRFACYRLSADIDLDPASDALAGKPAIAPVGTARNRFSGYFDGDGHSVNVAIDATGPYQGLFGVTDGAVFANTTITGSVEQSVDEAGLGQETLGCVGSLVGYAFDSLRVESCVNRASVHSNGSAVSGLVGIADAVGYDVQFRNCMNAGTVTSDEYLAAGLVSDVRAARVVVKGCSNTGAITARDLAAGLVGRPGGSVSEHTKVVVSGSFNEGPIAGDYRCGGLVGSMYAYSEASIRNAYNTGDITSQMRSGYASYMTNGSGASGGLVGGVGSNCVLAVERAYNAGILATTDSTMGLGGLVGYVYSGAKSVSLSKALFAGAVKSVGNQRLASGFSDSTRAVDEATLKSAAALEVIGGGFEGGSGAAMGGFPSLKAMRASAGAVGGAVAQTGRLRVAPVAHEEYRGEAVVPAVVVYDVQDGSFLEDGVGYEVTCENNVNPGKASLKVTGLGAHAGQVELAFQIVAADFEDCTVEPIDDMSVTGKAVAPKLAIANDYGVMLEEGVDFAATYADNVGKGTARVNVVGTGFYEGSQAVTFNIVDKRDLGDLAKIVAIADQVYTGGPIEPEVVVTVGGKALDAANYKVSFSDNVNAGTAKVAVTGTGGYTGSVTTTFRIVPAAARIVVDPAGVVGTKFKVKTKAGTFSYKVTGLNAVTLRKAWSTRAKSLEIVVVRHGGVAYKVTALGPKAFANAKVTSLTLGPSVAKIGKGAFKGAKKLRTLVVRGSGFTKPASMRGCLTGSSVTVVKAANKKLRLAYKHTFGNKLVSGKAVRIA